MDLGSIYRIRICVGVGVGVGLRVGGGGEGDDERVLFPISPVTAADGGDL